MKNLIKEFRKLNFKFKTWKSRFFGCYFPSPFEEILMNSASWFTLGFFILGIIFVSSLGIANERFPDRDNLSFFAQIMLVHDVMLQCPITLYIYLYFLIVSGFAAVYHIMYIYRNRTYTRQVDTNIKLITQQVEKDVEYIKEKFEPEIVMALLSGEKFQVDIYLDSEMSFEYRNPFKFFKKETVILNFILDGLISYLTFTKIHHENPNYFVNGEFKLLKKDKSTMYTTLTIEK